MSYKWFFLLQNNGHRQRYKRVTLENVSNICPRQPSRYRIPPSNFIGRRKKTTFELDGFGFRFVQRIKCIIIFDYFEIFIYENDIKRVCIVFVLKQI